MLYEKVFRRIFRKWACDHDPVEVDKKESKFTEGGVGFRYPFGSYLVITQTTRFYECSFCGYKSVKNSYDSETIEHGRGYYR